MKKNMNIRKSMGMLLCLCSLSATAQEAWDIDRCMAYARRTQPYREAAETGSRQLPAG